MKCIALNKENGGSLLLNLLIICFYIDSITSNMFIKASKKFSSLLSPSRNAQMKIIDHAEVLLTPFPIQKRIGEIDAEGLFAINSQRKIEYVLEILLLRHQHQLPVQHLELPGIINRLSCRGINVGDNKLSIVNPFD
jgi:hypothetical protein